MEQIFIKKNLEYLKMLKNVSSITIGEETGIGRTVADYISGRSIPPVENLIKIAKYFEVSIDDLLLVDMKNKAIENLAAEPRSEYKLEKRIDAMQKQIEDINKALKQKK